MTDVDMFGFGDVSLQCGATLRNARLAYKTYGRLNSQADNAFWCRPFTAGATRTTRP